jgi:hypothetical protein
MRIQVPIHFLPPQSRGARSGKVDTKIRTSAVFSMTSSTREPEKRSAYERPVVQLSERLHGPIRTVYPAAAAGESGASCPPIGHCRDITCR